MLNHTNYLVKEHVTLLKLTDTYDILDPSSGQKLGYAFENINMFFKLLRLLVNKRLLPSTVEIRNDREELMFSMKKGPQFLRTKVEIINAKSEPVGYFKSKLLTLGGAFEVFDKADNKVADVKGDWKGWNFKFTGNNGMEIGTVTKKWAGIGKEFFTSADNYMIAINDKEINTAKSMLLLAAGLAIDIVFKEKK